MANRANDPITIPDSFWQRAETLTALRARDIGRLFQLITQYTGASQTRIGIACGFSQGKISRIMNHLTYIEELDVFHRIADGLNMPDHARITLGLAPRIPAARNASVHAARPAIPPRDTDTAPRSFDFSGLLNLGNEDRQEDHEAVRRRDFVGASSAALLSAVFAEPLLPDAEPFAVILTEPAAAQLPQQSAAPNLIVLSREVNNARRQYQACRYSDLIQYLPGLLTRLESACLNLAGDTQSKAFTLSADAFHVAAGLLLKLDDQGLAYLAADRSMRAAQASEDPITVAASARIITHTLMKSGHLTAAISTASKNAARLDRDMPDPTPDSLSVYGSLLLRGAVAAAQHGKRDTAHELLAEADDAGRRLGVEGNLRGTAFGPANARLHRVNIAATLGDAGTAIDVARGIDLTKITVTERKASLFVDTARAFLQWGRHEKAYIAMRAAEATAHEEVAGRPSVHRIIRELLMTAPPSIRRDVEQFATQIGVTR